MTRKPKNWLRRSLLGIVCGQVLIRMAFLVISDLHRHLLWVIAFAILAGLTGGALGDVIDDWLDDDDNGPDALIKRARKAFGSLGNSLAHGVA